MNAAPETSTRHALEMHGVSVGSVRDVDTIVVEGVNWSVAPGDFWIISGLQGAGKSDFLMMTGGLMAPVAGTYYFLGEEMPIFEDHRLPDRLKLGFVFESGQLFNQLTISENISLPLRYHRELSREEAAPEVQKLMELTELAPFADSTPGAMARNWQRRAGLARALILRPEVLLLDNPLAGLDLRHRAWWTNLLEKLSRGHEWMNGRPMTIIVTTNDLRLWRGGARQFALLKDKHFAVLGDWKHVEAAGDELVREMRTAAPLDE
jgi:ABC-type transporter Mla maintaining outer membrane lipid asymmetry ATPase subunit MlaF